LLSAGTSWISTHRDPDRAPMISAIDSSTRVRCPVEGSPDIGLAGQTDW
jgi:hypothetical protein